MRAELEIPLKIDEIIEAVGGFAPHIVRSEVIRAITTDTREMQPGDLFIALKGENFYRDFTLKSLLKNPLKIFHNVFQKTF